MLFVCHPVSETHIVAADRPSLPVLQRPPRSGLSQQAVKLAVQLAELLESLPTASLQQMPGLDVGTCCQLLEAYRRLTGRPAAGASFGPPCSGRGGLHLQGGPKGRQEVRILLSGSPRPEGSAGILHRRLHRCLTTTTAPPAPLPSARQPGRQRQRRGQGGTPVQREDGQGGR